MRARSMARLAARLAERLSKGGTRVLRKRKTVQVPGQMCSWLAYRICTSWILAGGGKPKDQSALPRSIAVTAAAAVPPIFHTIYRGTRWAARPGTTSEMRVADQPELVAWRVALDHVGPGGRYCRAGAAARRSHRHRIGPRQGGLVQELGSGATRWEGDGVRVVVGDDPPRQVTFLRAPGGRAGDAFVEADSGRRQPEVPLDRVPEILRPDQSPGGVTNAP